MSAVSERHEEMRSVTGAGTDTVVRLLGAVGLTGPDGAVTARGTLLRTLLALLSIGTGRVVGTSLLIDELWGEDLPHDPRAALQIQVTRLRAWLEQVGEPRSVLRSEHGGYLLDLPPSQVDLVEFGAAADHALHASGPAERRLAACDAALARWRGEPFGGCVLSVRLEGERVRAMERQLQLAERRCELLIDAGLPGDALDELAPLRRRHQDRERLTALTMTALYRTGRQREALGTYAETKRYLREEFGLEPDSELVRLQRMILDQSTELRPRPEPAPTPLRPAHPGPPLIGRDPELRVVREHLVAPGSGSVIVVEGEAGIGKTALLGATLHEASRDGAAAGMGCWDADEAPLAGWYEALTELGVNRPIQPGGEDRLAGRWLRAALADAGRDRKLVLALDDAHLADSVSMGLLRSVARLGLPAGVLVLVGARPSAPGSAWSRTLADLAVMDGVTCLTLRELAPDAVHTVVAGRFGHFGEQATKRLSTAVFERTGGHSLHLSALLDSLRGSADEQACLRVIDRVPERLRPLLGHQLGELPAACVSVLETLAVRGPSTTRALAAALGRSSLELVEALRPAAELGVAWAAGDQVAFRHALTAQAVLDRIPVLTRRELHLARWSAVAGPGADPFEVLRHAVGAGPLVSPEQRTDARLAAGRAAHSRGACAEAAVVLAEARTEAAGTALAEVELVLGLALAALGRTEESDDLLDRVAADDRSPARAVVEAALSQPLGLHVAGDARRRARLVEAHRRAPEQLRLPVLQALVNEEILVFGRVLTPGAERELAELTRAARDAAEPLAAGRLAVVRARQLVDAPVAATERLAAAEDAYECALRAGDTSVRMDATELLLSAALAAGQPERARDLCWSLGQEARRLQRPRSIWTAKLLLAALGLASGAPDDGQRAAEEALRTGTELGVPDAAGAFGFYLANRGLLRGTMPSAGAAIEAALEHYPHIPGWWAVAAAAAMQAGDTRAARARSASFRERRGSSLTRLFDRSALCFAAAAAFGTGDLESARMVRDCLPADPVAVVVGGVGVATIFGPVNLYIGLADWTLGDHDAARDRWSTAATLAAGLGWEPWREAAEALLHALPPGTPPPGTPTAGPTPLGPAAALPLGLRLP